MVQKHSPQSLYHQALELQAQQQPVVKHTAAKALLMTAPNNIIFELFNTIVKEISSDKLLEFIKNNLSGYIEANWSNNTTKRAIERLRREQAVDIKAGLLDVPIIRRPPLLKSSKTSSPQIKSSSREESPQDSARQQKQRSPPLTYKASSKISEAVQQVYNHIMWRINTNNVTQITSLIVKLALDSGYKQGKLKAELYGEVLACFEDWRSSKLIKLYAFGDAPANDQRLLLANTNHGDLTKWIANYIDGSEKREKPDLLRKLAGALRDKTKNCIFITNNLTDAVRSLQTDSIRCSFVVDRKCQYEQLQLVANFSDSIEPLLKSGKLYVMSSLDCVQFAPDPTSAECC